MPIDFKKLLSPEARERLARHKRQVEHFASMTKEELVNRAEYYISNCAPTKHQKCECVYDAVVWHVIIPELIKRLKGN